MLGDVETIHAYFQTNLIFSVKARRGLQSAKTKCVTTKLRAVLVSGESDSAQC